MKQNMYLKTVFLICIIAMMNTSSITRATIFTETPELIENYKEQQNHYYRFKNNAIAVFYEQEDDLAKATGESLVQSIGLMTPNIIGFEISKLEAIHQIFNENEFMVAIYIFPSSIDSLQINSNGKTLRYSWSRTSDFFNDLIANYPVKHHIFSMGNTLQLVNLLNSQSQAKIHATREEKVDGHHMFLYSLWTLADILENEIEGEYKFLGKDIRKASAKYFADNFNDIISRSFEPQDILGEESPEIIQNRKDKFFDKHSPTIQRIPRDGYIVDPEKMRDKDPITGEMKTNDYVMDVFPKTSQTEDDYILQSIPTESGLRGPIGGIIDNLLLQLISQKIDSVGVSINTMDDLGKAVGSILDIFGILQDPSASKIKQYIKSLKDNVPISPEAYPFIDLLIDGFSLLAGDTNEIIPFLHSIIDLIPADITIGVAPLRDHLKQFVNFGNVISDRINKDGLTFQVIYSFLNEQIISNLTASTLINHTMFGLTALELQEVIMKINPLFNLLTNFFATSSLANFLEQGEYIFSTVYSDLGLTSTDAKMLMLPLAIILTVLNQFDNENIEDLLYQLLQIVSNQDQAIIRGKTKELILAISESVDKEITDINYFRNTMINPIINSLGIDQQAGIAIKNLLAIIATISSNKYDFWPKLNFGETIGEFAQSRGIIPDRINVIKNITKRITSIIYFVNEPPRMSDFIYLALGTRTLSIEIQDLISFIMDDVSNALFRGDDTFGLVASRLIAEIGELVGMTFEIIQSFNANPFDGIFKSILVLTVYAFAQSNPTDLIPSIIFIKNLFGDIIPRNLSYLFQNKEPDLEKDRDEVFHLISASISFYHGIDGQASFELVRNFFTFFSAFRDLFTIGSTFIFDLIGEWILGLVPSLIDTLENKINQILKSVSWDIFSLDLPFEIGVFSLVNLKISLSLAPHYEIDLEAFISFLFNIIFNGFLYIFTGGTSDMFGPITNFIQIIPVFSGSFELSDFGSGAQAFLDYLLDTLGIQFNFSGEGNFVMQLFSIKGKLFKVEGFFKLIDWVFNFKVSTSITLSLMTIATGGVGGGLESVGEYLGLDAIKFPIGISIAIIIIRRPASVTQPETGTLAITIDFSIAAKLDTDLVVGKFHFLGTLLLTLTLLQDLTTSTPLQVYIAIRLIISVTIEFLFWEWNLGYQWSPSGFEPPLGYNLSAISQEEAIQNGALGGDKDNDGLSDLFELHIAGLNPNSFDTDNDTLSDKMEIEIYKTNPNEFDTDFDGLPDNVELNLKINPLRKDTDFDSLDDYQEVVVIGTNPLSSDTDGDGLSDYYEVKHSWNISGITPSVTEVIIGGVSYNDRTDPLNPDTDGDGLLDGQEGPGSIFYGPELIGGFSDYGYNPDPPLIYNNGYTHPLDNDTDDDSYLLLYDGSIAPVAQPFIMDLGDYAETNGIKTILIDPITGEPKPSKIIHTNPVNPDSDFDTGVSVEERQSPPTDQFLLSDGFELGIAHTDPLDGDSDDDGLIDGLEGMLSPYSNHTDPFNPDTDGDGLGDLQEIQLGTDGRSIDTDRDGVPDGEEFFKFYTDPLNEDSDLDGVLDGDEVYVYHTNPYLKDSDADGISDYNEIWKFYSDPLDEDGDKDGISDFDEIFIYNTDPFDEDTDNDLLLDGEEINGMPFVDLNGITYTIFTDPNSWDSDSDSLTTLDQYDKMSMPMSDYDEIILGTNPTSRDSDLDGIEDGWELWLGKGVIPEFKPIKLDPMNNDTDGDLLLDGTELHITNITTLLYPYINSYLIYPYNSSPVSNDTDSDFLDDRLEINLWYNPNDNDTDNDSLSDYEEYVIYDSDGKLADTDGDGILDPIEINGFIPADLEGSRSTYLTDTIFTDVSKSDSDGDLLPDGAEIYNYGRDPTNEDENRNNILDGMEIDSDGDGLWDGEEYYIYKTIESPFGGGPFEPDSDRDGLFDGMEIYKTQTIPSKWDTDLDSYSDGLEVYCNTNPNDNSTTIDEIESCMSDLARLAILSPVSKEYKTNSIPVIVFDSTMEMVKMEYRVKLHNEIRYGRSIPMYETSNRGYWEGVYLSLPGENGTYNLEVLATNKNSETTTRMVIFSLNVDLNGLSIVSPKERTYSFNEIEDPKLPIKVKAGLNYDKIWYRMKKSDGSILQDNTTLTLEPGLNLYQQLNFKFPKVDGNKTYYIEVFGHTSSNDEFMVSQVFWIKTPTLIVNAVIVAAPLAVVTIVYASVKKGSFNNPFKKKGSV